MAILIRVLPGNLRLPSSRRTGPDQFKYGEQVRKFGSASDGMPPIQVTRGADGELMINDGVTRAFRVHRRGGSGTLVLVEVIDDRQMLRLKHLPCVKDV